ncbi:IclR family transcriptional regulator [Thermodesulfobacteriota bacterium]
MADKYKAPAVKKAFQILKLISESNKGLRISELAKSLGISKGTVHGITAILEELGAVKRDTSSKRYELGLTLFELGRMAYSQVDLRVAVRPVMEELMEKVKETVFFGVLNGERTTILDLVECKHDFKITSPIGTTIPLFAGATGKALLSVMDEKDAMMIIKRKGLPRYTDKSITDPEPYIKEIRDACRNGYAVDDEEYISGVRAVAAPLDWDKYRLAAIWIVGFKMSLDENKMELLKREIREAVKAVSHRIRIQSGLKVEKVNDAVEP